MLSRRSFFTGATAVIITAPAIVRVASIMPVRVIEFTPHYLRIRFPNSYTILADGKATVVVSLFATDLGKPLSANAIMAIKASNRIVESNRYRYV